VSTQLKLTLLGTGNPRVNLQRSGPSQVVWAGDEPLLVDCGLGTTHQLLRVGIDPSRVRNLFFTHHSDHNLEYAGFAISSWALGRPDLRVFGPAGTDEITRTLFGQVYAVDIAYRGDTTYCEGVINLARGASILVNNCSRPLPPERWTPIHHLVADHQCMHTAPGRTHGARGGGPDARALAPVAGRRRGLVPNGGCG